MTSTSFLFLIFFVKLMITRLLLDGSIWLCHGHRFVKLYVSCACVLFFIHFLVRFLICFHLKQCITFTGSHLLLILETCLNHVSLRCAILSTNVFSRGEVLRTVCYTICCQTNQSNMKLAPKSKSEHVCTCLYMSVGRCRAHWAVSRQPMQGTRWLKASTIVCSSG